jgi:hypothetical protein
MTLWVKPALLAFGLALLGSSAQASTLFDFTITSPNGDASGQITATEEGSSGIYDVSSVTGTVGSNAIGSLSSYGSADNKIFEPAPFVDHAGLAFVAGSNDYNIFNNPGGSAFYSFCSSAVEPSCTGGEANDTPAATFTLTEVTATPLPAALPLFAGGLGAMGLLGWRRKKTATLAA